MHIFVHILHRYAFMRKIVPKRKQFVFIIMVQFAEFEEILKKDLHIYSIGATISTSKTIAAVCRSQKSEDLYNG